jgi:hypothetical protein
LSKPDIGPVSSADGAGGEQKIRALERAVAEGRGLDNGIVAGKPGAGVGLRE